MKFEQINVEEFQAEASCSMRSWDGSCCCIKSDPAATLRHVASLVRPGGRLIFHEMDFGAVIPPWPEAPLWMRTYTILAEVSGAEEIRRISASA